MFAPEPESDRQNSIQPNISRVPKFLLVDDDFFRVVSTKRYLNDLGYDVDAARDPDGAIPLLKVNKYDLVIVDGDLGDQKWGHDSISARFIKDHLQDTNFGRLSGAVGAIPKDLHGKFAVETITQIDSWLKNNFPIGVTVIAKLPPLPVDESGQAVDHSERKYGT